MEEIVALKCLICVKTEAEADLIDMKTNFLECGEKIVEFNELFETVFDCKIDIGHICSECKESMIQFYFFKLHAQPQLSSLKNGQRSEIIRKLDMFLEDFADITEDYAVLRYNRCFTVVPESKRSLMENFQSWQPRAMVRNIEEYRKEVDEMKSTKIIGKMVTVVKRSIESYVKPEETKQEPEESMQIEEMSTKVENITENNFEEIIVEADEIYEIEQEDFIIEEDETCILPTMSRKSLKTSKEQREWANETTKHCYSIEKTEDGTEIPTWHCSICGKLYRSAQALRLHFLAKHLGEENDDELTLTPEIKDWMRKENRERRTVIETEDGDKFEWNCGICKFTCCSSKTFRGHLIDIHIKEDVRQETWRCLKCDLPFDDPKMLREHLQEHDNQSIVEATVKPRARKSKASNLQWICNLCHFQFTAQRSFDAHARLHETLSNLSPFTELFRCDECKMFFRSDEDLSSHLDGHAEGQSLLVPAQGIALQKTILFKRLPIPPETHESDETETCGHCGRRLVGDIICKSHILIHHVNPLVCPKDDRVFTSMQPFICHLQKVHAEMLPESLRCTHCRVSFENIYERLAHMKLCDEKKFACDHCDKRFSNKNYLNSHLKREMGLLSCKCQVCGKVVKAKDELKIHMRSHTHEKPFKCSICEKRYTTTSARASHMETHKDTLIQCEICAVKFVARRHYIVHYKRYHDEVYRQKKFQDQTCRICEKQFLRKDRLRDHMLKAHPWVYRYQQDVNYDITTITDGTEVLVSGWGETLRPWISNRFLREVVVSTVCQTECNTKHNETITDQMVCAAGTGKDSCQVPMQDVVSKKLVGVVSFREGCADLKYPEVYARVAVVRDWIELQLTAESMNTQR